MYKVKIASTDNKRRVAAHNIKGFSFYENMKVLPQADPSADARRKIADAIATFGTNHTDAKNQQLFKDVFQSIRRYKEQRMCKKNDIPIGVSQSICSFLGEPPNNIKLVRTATIAKLTDFKLLCQ